MNKWKIAFFVTLILALVSNGFLVIQNVDCRVFLSYLQKNYDGKSRQFNALGELVVAGAAEYTKSDILYLLRQADAGAFIVEEGNVLRFKEVRFVFEGDQLTKVE
jgi:hypothetical protein